MACIIDHHFTRALVDSAVLRCVRSRTTMYSCSSFTEVKPCANNRISRSMGATISVPNMNNGVSVYKWVRLRTVCIVSDINDTVHVEAKRKYERQECKVVGKSTPHDFIRNCAHLVGEAILMPTVLLRGDGHGTRRVPDVLSYCVSVWTADLYKIHLEEHRGQEVECAHPEINVQVAATADLVRNRHLEER